MAAGGLSLSSLTEEFQEAKKRLKEVEEGIQKHTGRPSLQQRLKPRIDAPAGIRSQLANRLDDGPFRRHQGGAFSRLGRQLNANEVRDMGPNHNHGFQKGMKRQREEAPAERDKAPKKDEPKDEEEEEEDEPPRKMGLQSLIGASSMTVKQKSRTELLNEQRSDTSGKERNKRMFGMILGTLKSFEKEETTKRKEQVDKKVEKEQKVEEMKQKEREEDIRQRRELLTEKREKLTQLKKLQSKMEVVGAFEEFSKRHRYMMNFIHTGAKPPIMWLPKVHTKETEKLLARSKAKIQIIIEKEEERMLLEVERIEGITRASDGEPDEKENSHLPSSVAVVVKHDQKDNASGDANGDTEQKDTESDLKNIKIVIENDMTSSKDLNGDQKQKAKTESTGPAEKSQTKRASRSPSRASQNSDVESQENTERRSPALPQKTAKEQSSSPPPRGRPETKKGSRSSSSSSSSSSSPSSDHSVEKNKNLVAKRRSRSPKPKRGSPARKASPPVRTKRSPSLTKRSPSPKRGSRPSASPNRRPVARRSSSSSSSGSAASRQGGSPVASAPPRRRSKSPRPRSRSPVRRRSPSPAIRRTKRSRSPSLKRRSGSPAPKKPVRRRSPSPRRRSRSPRRIRRSRSPRRRR